MSYGKNVSRQPFLDALSKHALVLLHQQHLVRVPVITLVHRVVDSVNVYPRIIVMLTSICQISVSRSGLLSDSGSVGRGVGNLFAIHWKDTAELNPLKNLIRNS